MMGWVSGCPGGEGVGRQCLTLIRRDSSARCEGQRGIAEPAAGPAESCASAAGQISVTADGLAAAGGDGLAGGAGGFPPPYPGAACLSHFRGFMNDGSYDPCGCADSSASRAAFSALARSRSASISSAVVRSIDGRSSAAVFSSSSYERSDRSACIGTLRCSEDDKRVPSIDRSTPMLNDTSKKLGVGAMAVLVTVTLPFTWVVSGRPGRSGWNRTSPLVKRVRSMVCFRGSSFAMGGLSSGKGAAAFLMQRAARLVGRVWGSLPDQMRCIPSPCFVNTEGGEK